VPQSLRDLVSQLSAAKPLPLSSTPNSWRVIVDDLASLFGDGPLDHFVQN
jgi:hypothetical protein